MKKIKLGLLAACSCTILLVSGQAGTYIAPSAKITVHAGSMSVWGDMNNGFSTVNSGSLTIKDGSKIIFYGTTWTNSSTGNISGDVLSSGEVDFVNPRPAPYAGVFSQNLNGGGEAQSFPSLRISNAQNVYLLTSSTRARARLTFAVDDGHIISNGNDLIIGDGTAAPGSIAGYNPLRYFVTNQASVGHLVRNGFNNAAQVFPVGFAENDYTPASILPGMGITRVSVNVNDYVTSASNETILMSKGVNRTWSIYANAAGDAQVSLQHNTNTNNTGAGGPIPYADANGFIVYNQNLTTWASYVNPPPSFAIGNLQDGGALIPGSAIHTRMYPLATSNYVAAAHFTKDFSGAILPVSGLTFTGRFNNGTVQLDWRVLNEFNLSHYEITRSIDGVQFNNIGRQQAGNTGSAVYVYNDDIRNITADKVFYRLRLADKDGSIKLSPTVLINLKKDGGITVYPNPASSYINISIAVQSAGRVELVLFNVKGQLVKKQVLNLQAGVQNIQMKELDNIPAGQYELSVRLQNGQIIKQKVLIMHQ